MLLTKAPRTAYEERYLALSWMTLGKACSRNRSAGLNSQVEGYGTMVRLRITWKYCIAFYCIIMLYASLHELIHHFSGYLICGDWGYKTFNYFATACEGTRKSWYATYTGPLFSFLMMYVGAYFLKNQESSYRRHLGFAMIFAQTPLHLAALST